MSAPSAERTSAYPRSSTAKRRKRMQARIEQRRSCVAEDWSSRSSERSRRARKSARCSRAWARLARGSCAERRPPAQQRDSAAGAVARQRGFLRKISVVEPLCKAMQKCEYARFGAAIGTRQTAAGPATAESRAARSRRCDCVARCSAILCCASVIARPRPRAWARAGRQQSRRS